MKTERAHARGQAGYSMVELLAAVTITLLIMAGVLGLMVQNQQVYETETNVADMQQNMRIALDLITREVRMAGSDPSGRAFLSGVDKPIESGQADEIHIKMDRPHDYWTPGPPATATPDGILEVVDGFDCSGCADLCDCPSKVPGTTDGKTDCEFENEFGDGCITVPGEDVLYRVQNNVLQRVLFFGQGNQSVQPLADNIKSLAFTYYTYVGANLEPITLEGSPPAVPDPSVIRKIKVTIVSQTEERVDRSQSPARRKEFTLESDIFLRNMNE